MNRVAIVLFSLALGGCSLVFTGEPHRARDAAADAQTGFDAGRDAGTDAGRDAGTDAGTDAGLDCVDAADGTACAPDRVCAAGSCRESTCGDGIRDERTEECDDANDVAADGCTACRLDCRTDADCDNRDPCDGRESCTAEGGCRPGDDPRTAGELCEVVPGTRGVCRADSEGNLACVAAACGNGELDADEMCDDGANGDDADGCTDACRFTCTNDSDCADGDVCNGAETCAADHTCAPGDRLDCDDGVPCTRDACVVERGCEHIPDSSVCSDGISCTDDACVLGVPGGCVSTPNNGRCDDGVPCTDNVCAPSTGGCIYPPNHGRCDDGVPCTADSCSAAGCANTPDDLRCGDGIDCTLDRCTATGCSYAPDDTRCRPAGCSTQRCVSGSGCQPSGSISNCRFISGRQVFSVRAGGPNGNSTCAPFGLTCNPIASGMLGGTNTACRAFDSSRATQTSPSSGFGGGVYCSGTTSGVCAGASNLCHECTGCVPIDCGTSASPALLTEFFVECR